MPSPSNPGDRAKAYRLRLRAKTQALEPVDALWLAEYEEVQEKTSKKGSKNFGASRSGRRIKLDVEEHAESVGTGTAASEAAIAAMATREEGKRLDNLLEQAIGCMKTGTDALDRACSKYESMCDRLLARTEIQEHTHVEMLQSVRAHFLASVQAEGALIQHQQQQVEGDPANQMLLLVIAKHLGIDIPGLPPQQPQQPQRPYGPQQRPQRRAPPDGEPQRAPQRKPNGASG